MSTIIKKKGVRWVTSHCVVNEKQTNEKYTSGGETEMIVQSIHKLGSKLFMNQCRPHP